jgi:hypothetical protein
MIIHSPIISGSLVFAPGATFTLPPGGIYSGSFSGSYQGSSFSGGTFTGNGSGLTFGGTGIVSGSSQVVGILSSLNTYTGSNNTTNTTQNSRLDQLSTASGSAITRLNLLEVETANLETFTSSINTTIKTRLNVETVVSGSSQVVDILTSLNTYTGSNNTTNTTQNSRLDQLSTASGSAITRLNLLEVETANLELYTASNDTKWSTLGSLSGSFARTNSSNIFNGSQTITGSLFVSQDLVVQGSSSIQNISSSNLVIGSSFVTLNTFSPSSRFAGLSIVDSGSSGGSGSFLYDSLQDELLFIHRGNGVNTTSSVLLMGPETYDNLGNETYLTNNRLPKGSGKEHLNDSNITDTGTLITLGSNTVITGTILASGTTLVSGSSQISHDSTTGYSANRHIDHTSITLTAGDGLTGGGTIADSRTFNVVGTTNRISVSADAVDIASTYVGQTSITTLGTIGTGTWQGSVIASAYLDTDTAHLSDTQTFTGAKTFSSAVNITNSTASTTITTGALIVTGGVGVSGALNVGGDVVAYASSDKRLKDNIKNIENPIQKVQKLNGVTWDWNSNADELQQSLPNVGVIAQEVEEVLPQ